MAGWIEIRAKGPARSRDAVSAVLIEAGSPGVLEEAGEGAAGKLVSYSRWEDETREEPPSNSSEAALRAYLGEGEKAKLDGIRRKLGSVGWKLTTSALKETDWSEKWKKGLRPVRVSYKGSSVLVRPTWKRTPKRPGEKVIEIDPGMAFGTGGHATTKMCLRAILRLVMDRKLPPNPDFLDVGTGTGVLAIAAKKLGFRKAVGLEIDEVAVRVARKNAAHNRVKVTLSSRPVERTRGRFRLVAANILAGELKRLSPVLYDRVSPGGLLILSGILLHEKDEVIRAYPGFALEKIYSSKEWVALVFHKPLKGNR
ncbi:MAG: 50S ribosomal protein L11 methyltransferase [Thermodesulfobacteriota bacterium]|nr:MAG: 50S ribosomal protein L11 methyltransferase [Thermodesulfobacteriota bacterium]